MTEVARRQQIQKALDAHAQMEAAERRPFPLSRGNTTLPVVSVPLAVPILNAKSFRIAPALLDHPKGAFVASDPDSPEAQQVVADLVRAAHKNAKDLKQSLKDEGQDEPGVITRSGVLINANTRCVLMRDLLADGDLRTDALRVAVLPPDVTPAELFDLEAVLQKQKDHKDQYDLVSELMMLRTLHGEAQMTEQQIAKRQRLSVSEILLRFRVLALMERARLLVEPHLPIKEFGGPKSQLQNWKELETRVQTADAEEGAESGDDVIREWLYLHLLDMGAVHNLRQTRKGWVDRHLLDALPKGGEIGAKVANIATSAMPAAPDSTEPVDDGTDLLDFGRPAEVDGTSVRQVLSLAMAARQAGPTGELEFPDGTKHAASDVLTVLKKATNTGLESSQLEISAGAKLGAPTKLLDKVLTAITAANKALYEVYEEPEFAPLKEAVAAILDDIAEQLDEARAAVDQDT